MKVKGIDEIIKSNNLDLLSQQSLEKLAEGEAETSRTVDNYANIDITNENPALIVDLRQLADFETNRYWGDELNVKIQKHHDEGDYIQKHRISKSERKRLVVDTSFNNDTINKVNFENDEKSIFTPSSEVIGQLKCNQTLPSKLRSKYTSIAWSNAKKFVYTYNWKQSSTNYTRR
jgi:hypothetical protein